MLAVVFEVKVGGAGREVGVEIWFIRQTEWISVRTGVEGLAGFR